MSELRTYPPSLPRLVATRVGRKYAEKYVSAASARARTRWLVAKSPILGDWLWRTPPADVRKAWDIGARFLRQDQQIIIGVLSDPGPEQRLTLIPADEEIVVKVAVEEGGRRAIERERANLAALEATPWRQLGPQVRDDPSRTSASRAVLLMDRVSGSHPKWDDGAVHRKLHCALSSAPANEDHVRRPGPAGAGLSHGDVTPWNVVERDDGSLALLDWEFADFSRPAHPVCGLLDFVLRGAVVARARPSRVRRVLLSTVRQAGVDSSERGDIVKLYRAYRWRVAELTPHRPDTLSRQADHLLGATLGAEATS